MVIGERRGLDKGGILIVLDQCWNGGGKRVIRRNIDSRGEY